MGSLAAFDLLEKDSSLVERLRENTAHFRRELTARGVQVREGIHPIVPIIVGDTAKAIAMSKELLDRGVYVSGFGFPVVPQGQARLRCQISAAHTREHLDRAIEAVVGVTRALREDPAWSDRFLAESDTAIWVTAEVYPANTTSCSESLETMIERGY